MRPRAMRAAARCAAALFAAATMLLASPTHAQPACVDTDAKPGRCADFASKGYCTNPSYVSFMEQNCVKTCFFIPPCETPAPPTPTPATSAPPTPLPPTPMPPTPIPPTPIPPTPLPPTPAPKTPAPPTGMPATEAPPTPAPSTLEPPTPSPATSTPPTPLPPTPIPPTPRPPTPEPATPLPTTAPSTPLPPTPLPSTPLPPTPLPQTPLPPTPLPPTGAPPSPAPATQAPQTPVPPTPVPLTDVPPTPLPETREPRTYAPEIVPPPRPPVPSVPAPPADDGGGGDVSIVFVVLAALLGGACACCCVWALMYYRASRERARAANMERICAGGRGGLRGTGGVASEPVYAPGGLPVMAGPPPQELYTFATDIGRRSSGAALLMDNSERAPPPEAFALAHVGAGRDAAEGRLPQVHSHMEAPAPVHVQPYPAYGVADDPITPAPPALISIAAFGADGSVGGGGDDDPYSLEWSGDANARAPAAVDSRMTFSASPAGGGVQVALSDGHAATPREDGPFCRPSPGGGGERVVESRAAAALAPLTGGEESFFPPAGVSPFGRSVCSGSVGSAGRPPILGVGSSGKFTRPATSGAGRRSFNPSPLLVHGAAGTGSPASSPLSRGPAAAAFPNIPLAVSVTRSSHSGLGSGSGTGSLASRHHTLLVSASGTRPAPAPLAFMSGERAPIHGLEEL